MIPYGHQSLDDDDVNAVIAVLKSDWLTQGPAVTAFEEGICERTGAQHAVAFANGTAALHGAAAVALGPGDLVATSPLSFVASANCARYVGADVTLVDIDPATLNLDPRLLPAGVDALVAVHFGGLPLDLGALAYRPRVVIEDACHALGASTPDGPVGNCARSDMCVFSFHPVKTITTGEGGIVTTNSSERADALRAFRNHGIVRRPSEGDWYYEVEGLGYNYRLTDLQAALGSSQLHKLDRFVERRNQLAARYRDALADLPLQLPPEAPAGWLHAYHLFPVQVADRRRVFDELRRAGVGVQVHYVPIYRHPPFAASSGGPAGFEHTERVYAGLLSLPLYPGLSEAEQDFVVDALRAAL
jgi:perosamine synthetase